MRKKKIKAVFIHYFFKRFSFSLLDPKKKRIE